MIRPAYSILGVLPTATADEIKAAYRKLAKRHHPDAGGNGEEFAAIAQAYDILSDAERRAHYDETGEAQPPQDTIRMRAVGMISELLGQVMTQDADIFTLDVMGFLKGAVGAQISQVEQQLAPLERARDRIPKMAGRFTRKGEAEEENLFEMILRSHTDRIERAIKPHADRLEVARMARALLADYDFAQDIPEMIQMYRPATSVTGGFGWR